MNSQKELTVVITGAAGQISYNIYSYILSGQTFGQDVSINLRLLDIEQCVGILAGVVLELEDGAFPLLKSIKVGSNPEELFKDCDVAIFLGGFPRKPGMERRDLLQINNKIFQAQGLALNKVAKPTCKSLVIANPANTNALTLANNCPNIPKKNFTCLTRLDHNRALAQISNKTGVCVDKIQKMTIWGNHSTTQYPDWHQVVIDGKPVSHFAEQLKEEYLKAEFIEKIQKRGGEVMAARKQSSVMSAAKAINDHLRSWVHGTPEGDWVSMGVYTETEVYGVPTGLFYSLPVTCKNFEYEVVQGLQLNDFSVGKMKVSTDELMQEREESKTA